MMTDVLFFIISSLINIKHGSTTVLAINVMKSFLFNGYKSAGS